MAEDSDELQCRGTTQHGQPCGVRPELVDEETGYCPAHDPDRKEERREIASMGGRATAAKRRGELTADELPELNEPADAERWLELIGRALVTDRISQRRADTLRKILKVWIKAHDKGRLADRFDRMVEALETYRETGDAGDLLEVVDGELS